MQGSANEAKNRFGGLSAQAKRGPVVVDPADRAGRRRSFEAEFADWIQAQNARVEAHGIPGADLRPW